MSNFMVLKCIKMSSGDWISIHENKCLVIKGVKLSNSYLGLDNENVYSFTLFLLTCWLYYSASFHMKIISLSAPGL